MSDISILSDAEIDAVSGGGGGLRIRTVTVAWDFTGNGGTGNGGTGGAGGAGGAGGKAVFFSSANGGAGGDGGRGGTGIGGDGVSFGDRTITT